MLSERSVNKMYMNPIDLFNSWYKAELQTSTDVIPSACCLSTIGLDGYPNARFVSLKEVMNGCFVITGSIGSLKGKEIAQCSKVALTFWWTGTQKQVRIQGEASLLSTEISRKYFHQRPLDAQIISSVSKQGHPLESMESLQKKFFAFKRPERQEEIPPPDDWGGYSIKPVRMELMTFKENRMHERWLYHLKDEHWTEQLIEP